jgi:hypothetical protein
VLEATQALMDACKGVGAAHAAGLQKVAAQTFERFFIATLPEKLNQTDPGPRLLGTACRFFGLKPPAASLLDP